MSTPYSAETFATLAELFDGAKAGNFPLSRHDARTVFAALRIAAAAYKPGVIETALRRQDMSGFVIPQNAAAIRLALLKDSSNG